jgi:hypothetical protein
MPSFCVRILKNGRPCGAGILVDGRHVVTCAHVVNSSFGPGRQAQEMLGRIVSLDFPWSTPRRLTSAKVVGWHPAVAYGAAHEGLADMAVLRLDVEVADKPADLDLEISAWGGQDFFTVGFTGNEPDGVNAVGRTQGMLTGNRIEVAAAGPFGGAVEPGFSGAPVSFGHPLDGGAIAGMVFAHGPEERRTAQLIPANRIYHAWLLARNPYKGLARFELDDAEMFFGRGQEIQDFMDRRADKKVTIIVGPAGSGKSSFLFGGLLPTIVRASKLRVARFRPGLRAMHNLLGALADVFPARRLEQIVVDPTAIMRAANWLVDERGTRLLLVADQMEEAFTLSDGAQRRDFFRTVKEIYLDPRGSVALLGTLGAEFLSDALRDEDLSALSDREFFLLRDMTSENLSKVIRDPANALKVWFEESNRWSRPAITSTTGGGRARWA